MSEYQGTARRWRPQTFQAVMGQDAIVTTIKNAIRNNKVAHAYLFCGSRGTGKTTLARVFAKALNCRALSDGCEPCNSCPSCREIAAGAGIDVLEIDGASHRGIDDVRQINETVGYAAASGKYKVYIIDEVHMLTKEAFNALLKTLEEPPPNVIFFFATTEPHKVPQTILSRCQRFNLNRIASDIIVDKLKKIAVASSLDIEDDALRLIAARAEGGLRDAESLFDQVVAFHDDVVTLVSVRELLGIMPKDCLFDLDLAGKEDRLSCAFEIAHQVFSEGKDLTHFVEMLVEHIRTLLLFKIDGGKGGTLNLEDDERARYATSASYYSKEQCLSLLEYLIEAQNKIRFVPSPRCALEAILLHLLQSHRRIPVEYLVKRLTQLEQALGSSTPPTPSPTAAATVPPEHPSSPNSGSNAIVEPPPLPAKAFEKPPEKSPTEPLASPPPTLSKIEAEKEMELSPSNNASSDPTPTARDFGRQQEVKEGVSSGNISIDPTPTAKEFGRQKIPETMPEKRVILKEKQSCYDTLVQFAAVELEGSIIKNF